MNPLRTPPPNLHQQITGLYKMGLQPEAIARKLIISYGLVQSTLCKARLLTDAQVQMKEKRSQIYTLNNAGCSTVRIAQKVNLPLITVQTILESISGKKTMTTQVLNDDSSTKQRPEEHKVISLAKKNSDTLDSRLILAKSMYSAILDGQHVTAVAKKNGLQPQRAISSYLELIGIGAFELKLIRRMLKSQEIITIKQSHKYGLTRSRMAQLSNMPPGAISHYFNIPESNIPYPDHKSLSRIKKALEFRVMHAEGMSFQDIAATCAVSVSTIMQYLSDAGLKDQPAGTFRIKQRERICQLAKEQLIAGKTIKEIASSLCLSSPTIIRYLKTVGIDTKLVYQERRQELKAAILAGKPVPLSSASVYRYLKDQGLRSLQQQKRKEALGQCKALWDAGKTCKEISARMLLGINTVRRYLKSAGIEFHAAEKQKDEAIKKLLLEGKSINEVMRTFSVSYERVSKWINKNDHKNHKLVIRAQRSEAFHRLFKQGLNLKEIAVAQGTSPTMVRIHLLEIGVDPSSERKARKKKILNALRAGKSIRSLVNKGLATYPTIIRYKMELEEEK